MSNSWLTRITASFAAVTMIGGMAFLSGCDDCDNCAEEKVTCCGADAAVDVAYERDEQQMESADYKSTERQDFRTDSDTRDLDWRNTDNREFQNEESRRFDTSVDTSDTQRWNDQEISTKRDRLIEIERERVQHPNQVRILDDEAVRLRSEINQFDNRIETAPAANRNTVIEQKSTDHSINIQNRSAMPADRSTDAVKTEATFRNDAQKTEIESKKEMNSDVNVNINKQNLDTQQNSSFKSRSESSPAFNNGTSSTSTSVTAPSASTTTASRDASSSTDASRSDASLKTDVKVEGTDKPFSATTSTSTSSPSASATTGVQSDTSSTSTSTKIKTEEKKY